MSDHVNRSDVIPPAAPPEVEPTMVPLIPSPTRTDEERIRQVLAAIESDDRRLPWRDIGYSDARDAPPPQWMPVVVPAQTDPGHAGRVRSDDATSWDGRTPPAPSDTKLSLFRVGDPVGEAVLTPHYVTDPPMEISLDTHRIPIPPPVPGPHDERRVDL